MSIQLKGNDNSSFAGNVTLPGGGGATQALQKQEIESLISATGEQYVTKNGDTMTGDLTVPNITVPGTGVISAMQTPKAMVVFQIINGAGDIEIYTQYNIDSVTFENSAGNFAITFIDDLPANPIIQATATTGFVSGGACVVYIRSGASSKCQIGTICFSGAGAVAETSNFYYVVWYGFEGGQS